MRKIVLLGLVGILAICAATGGNGTARAGDDGLRKHFRIGISQYPSTLHPLFDAMMAAKVVLGAALRPVMVENAGWVPECMLCTETPTDANGRITRAYNDSDTPVAAVRYTLRDDLFWDDGTPVTAHDIVFGWEVGKHPAAGATAQASFAEDIAAITAIDDHNFTIRFSRAKCDGARAGGFYPLPRHLERDIFESDPARYRERTLYNTAPDTRGLYMGPYRVDKITAGSAISLVPNPHWRGRKPLFDRVTFHTIENLSALAANLLSGDIDYIAGETGLPLDQAIAFEKRLKKTRSGAFNVVYKQGLVYEHMDLPLDRAPFDNLSLRQALLTAIDRDTINQALFGGRQEPARTNINPQDTIYTPDVATYAYDPARAAKLLDAAGYRIGHDGMRYNDNNEKLVVHLSTTAGNKSRETVQQAIQSDWRKLGITAIIENQTPRVFFAETLRKRAVKGGAIYAWLSAPRSIPKSTLHSRMIPTADNNYAGQNYPAYINPEMDRVLDDLERVCGEKDNRALWHRLQEIYAETLPSLPLFYRADSYFIPARLRGVEPTGHLHPTTLWIENWRLAAHE